MGAIGNGLNNVVNALAVYNGALYAGGYFSLPGGTSNIAMWNGTEWVGVGNSVNNVVSAMIVYNGDLYVGGCFTQAGKGEN